MLRKKDILMDKQVKDFWSTQKKSACPDDLARDLSIETILKYLSKGAEMIDIGCGNGYCTYQFANTEIAKIIGVDFSEDMIKNANEAKKIYPLNIKRKIDFKKGDIRSLEFDNGSKDIVVTIRCLINVPMLEDKERAINEIMRVLKIGGLYLMCENTLQGLSLLNSLRQEFELPLIKARWHNSYLDEEWLNNVIKANFEVLKVEHFASLYYLISRVVYAKFCSIESEEPDYNHPLNKISKKLCSMLEPYGEFSPMRLYVLRKKC